MKSVTMINTFALCILLIASLCQLSCSIRFNLRLQQKKCLKGEIYSDQLAVGEYEVSEQVGSTVDLTVTDSKGHTVLNRENIVGKSKFAVTSDSADLYEICFVHTATSGAQAQAREISLDYKVGSEAKEVDENVKTDFLDTLERELDRIESMTNSIIYDFAYLKRRGREIRNTNESTNTRLFYQSVISIIILFVLATWQILYLRTFFRARKLID